MLRRGSAIVVVVEEEDAELETRFGEDEAVVERMEWKWLSQVGSAPRVAMDEIWMTRLGGVVDGGREGTGMVERISLRPSQPKDVRGGTAAEPGL